MHFAFFLKNFKNSENKDILQEIYDYIFRQLELSIREIGYGDQSINKKMKDYLNVFYGMIDKIDTWNNCDKKEKKLILSVFLNKNEHLDYLVDYFDKYFIDLSNNTLTSYIKGVVKH